jgi:predicted permease
LRSAMLFNWAMRTDFRLSEAREKTTAPKIVSDTSAKAVNKIMSLVFKDMVISSRRLQPARIFVARLSNAG